MTPWSRAATLAEATSRAVLALPAPVHDLLQIGDPTPPTSSPGALAAICQAFSASPLNQVGYSPWFGDRPMVAVGDGLECMPLAAHGPTALPAWLLAAAWHGMGQDIWDENEVILDAHADDVDRLDAALGGDGRWRGVAAWFRDPGNRDRASTAPTLAQIAIESEILLSLAPPRAEAAYRHGLAAIASASRPAIDAGALGPWSTPLAAHVLWATVQRGDQPDTTWAAICTLDAAAGIGTGVTVPGHLSVPVMAVSSGVLRAAAAAATATRDPVP
ncbi:MAG TPA: hypothetical protein PKA64_10165, partial [Myxococcota bacterium]|nr:hypothetical protein [Myxococcota bacterium]